MTLIQTLLDTFFSGQQTMTMEKQHEARIEIKPHTNNAKYSEDVDALEKHFGTLDNRNIEIDLHDLLAIAPRNRKRADAYHGLVSHLKRDRNAKLTIKTKRKL